MGDREPKPEHVEEWRELNTRWFQFGTFCGLLRSHGQFPLREMWNFGGDEKHKAYTTMLAFDRLRYRLLPYLYSVNGDVTRRDAAVHASAGDGLPRGRRGAAASATSSCSARRCS